MNDPFTTQTSKAIGNRIKSCRKSKGYTQLQLACELGLSERQYSRFETGETLCNIAYLYNIANILDASADYILYGNTNNIKHISILIDKLTPSDRHKLYKIIEAFCS